MMTRPTLAAPQRLFKTLFISSFLTLTAAHIAQATPLDDVVALAHQGDYAQAYTQTLEDRNDDPRRTSILAGLQLGLAQAAQNRGQLDESARWLHTYTNSGSNPYPHLYAGLITRQNELSLGRAVANRYSRELRIGLMLPLSGPLAGIGQSLLRAAQLAVFQQPYDNLRLFPIDSQSGLEAFNTLQSLQVDMVVGPLLAQTVNLIKDAANSSHIPVIAFSSDRSVAGGEVHLISDSPAQQARLMAQFAAREGKTKLAALVPNTPYGQEVLSAFKDEATQQGLEFMTAAFYDPASNDLSKPIKTLAKLKPPPSPEQRERNTLEATYKKQGDAMAPEAFKRLKALRRLKTDKTVTFDALFLPSTAESLPLITSQLVYNDIDSDAIFLLGTSLWDDPKALASKGEYMRNAFFPAAAEAPSRDFRSLYLQTYGQAPHALAPLAYDTVIFASTALRDGHAFDLNTALASALGYYGAGGAFRFGSHGLAERLYDLVQITPQGFARKQASPDAFLPPDFGSDSTPPSTPDHPRWFDRLLPRE